MRLLVTGMVVVESYITAFMSRCAATADDAPVRPTTENE
jgi:hypothetical protein